MGHPTAGGPLLAAVLVGAAPPATTADSAGTGRQSLRPRTSAPADAYSAAGGSRPADPGWPLLSTRAGSGGDLHHAYIGNGYLGQRVPPAGTGYTDLDRKTGWPPYTPRATTAPSSPGSTHAARRRPGAGTSLPAIPTWPELSVGTGEGTFGPSPPANRVSDYRQTALLRCGLVRTSLTRTDSEGRATDLVYDVLADRTDPHTAAVRVRMTPQWSGDASVTDVVDGRGARRVPRTGGGPRPGGRTVDVTCRTDGTDVDGAAIGRPGCSTRTSLMRSVKPFVRGPLALFPEARGDKAGAKDPLLSGSPAQDFLTGKGGFLQVFTNGLTGMRRHGDYVRLDPMLPPPLGDGVTVRSLHWQGRTVDVSVGPQSTAVRLTGGGPFEVETPQGRRTVSEGSPAILETRRPDPAPADNLARCRAAAVGSEEPGMYALAAVDSSGATAWVPDAAEGSLRGDLGGVARIGRVDPEWTGTRTASSRLEVSLDGRHGRTVGAGGGSGEPAEAVEARRVQVTAGARAATSRSARE